MEQLKAYIESGVLELYVLGDLSESERHDVELMLAKYPELKVELHEIEEALSLYANKHAIEPSADLKAKVLDALDYAEQNSVKTIEPVFKQLNYYKYAFAASVALLLISIISLIQVNKRLQESNNRIAVLETSNEKFSVRVNDINQELLKANQALEVFQNPGQYKMVALKGTPQAPAASMMVAFNPSKAMVMIDLAALKMPQHDESHQYQLWALVDGKPVDLGVFDANHATTGMIKMKGLKYAQAFAVTLEPIGGSLNPTLTQMMVMGSI